MRKAIKHWATQDRYGIDFGRWLADLGSGITLAGTPTVKILTLAGLDVSTEFAVAGQNPFNDGTRTVRLLERGTDTGADQRSEKYILVAESDTTVPNVRLSAAVMLVVDQEGRPPSV